MEHDNKNGKSESVYSKVVKAGKRRTYFLDVRSTRANDYFITITESKKRLHDEGYDRHKIFLYKEDFNKFVEAMNDTVHYVKKELLPEYDFDEFSNRYEEEEDEDGNKNNFDKKSPLDDLKWD